MTKLHRRTGGTYKIILSLVFNECSDKKEFNFRARQMHRSGHRTKANVHYFFVFWPGPLIDKVISFPTNLFNISLKVSCESFRRRFG